MKMSSFQVAGNKFNCFGDLGMGEITHQFLVYIEPPLGINAVCTQSLNLYIV